MGLRSRLNKLEQDIKPKEKDPIQAWMEHIARIEEMESLFPHVIMGDLQACIRYCDLSNQGEKWKDNGEGMLDSLYQYRNVFIDHAAKEKKVKSDYETETSLDVFYHNLKATFRYLEAKAEDPEAKEPGLKVFQGKEILPISSAEAEENN
jgi:hypothetical protein